MDPALDAAIYHGGPRITKHPSLFRVELNKGNQIIRSPDNPEVDKGPKISFPFRMEILANKALHLFGPFTSNLRFPRTVHVPRHKISRWTVKMHDEMGHFMRN